MFRYAKTKRDEAWLDIRGDVMVTMFTLIMAYLTSRVDLFGLERRFLLSKDLSFIITFFLGILVYLIGVNAFYLAESAIFGKKVSIELELTTKQGRPKWGRYLGVYIFNKSRGTLEFCSLSLVDVRAVQGKWKPPAEAIAREDDFLWGTAMMQRSGKKSIKRNNINDTNVDLLHTGHKKKKGKVYFTLQYGGEEINAPVGDYEIDIEFKGTHLGHDFNIPLSIRFRFDGGMTLSKIEPIGQIEERIKRLRLDFDKKRTIFKD